MHPARSTACGLSSARYNHPRLMAQCRNCGNSQGDRCPGERNRPARPNQTILIRDSRIATIGDASRVEIPRGSLVIDASGKFAIPGIWDMHVHFRGSTLGNKGSFVRENEAMVPLYLANGHS